MTWQVQEAKNKLSEVMDTAAKSGPQIISRRGRSTSVIISFADYRRYIAPAPKQNFKDKLRRAPINGLDLSRDPSASGRQTKTAL